MTIVVGYLATAEGREALETAALEARSRDAELVVVVSAKQTTGDGDVERLRAEIATVADVPGAEGVSHRVVVGGNDVAEDLVSTAEQLSAELIVIGLRRRSPVGKLILGSNAQRILLDAPCPVLAVKPHRP
ncbi:universal stress protein [Oerskovia flava]|uniref:universal stress protein n=1 Tax=Oerskovia flava TaxID=2986422 RepID=UPI0022400942|nr:universal stress protein [Oerskovia sp. JB1-3-2]